MEMLLIGKSTEDVLVKAASMALPLDQVRKKVSRIDMLGREFMAKRIDAAAYFSSLEKIDLPGYAWLSNPDRVRQALLAIGFPRELSIRLADSQRPYFDMADNDGNHTEVGILFAQWPDRRVGVFNVVTKTIISPTVAGDGDEIRGYMREWLSAPGPSANRHINMVLSGVPEEEDTESHLRRVPLFGEAEDD